MSLATIRAARRRGRDKEGGYDLDGGESDNNIHGCVLCENKDFRPNSAHLAWECPSELLSKTRPSRRPNTEVQRRLGWPDREKMTAYDMEVLRHLVRICALVWPWHFGDELAGGKILFHPSTSQGRDGKGFGNTGAAKTARGRGGRQKVTISMMIFAMRKERRACRVVHRCPFDHLHRSSSRAHAS